MKAAKIFYVLFRAAIVVTVMAFSFNFYEGFVLPSQPTVDRTVIIHIGKGNNRYCTQQEYVLNEIVLIALNPLIVSTFVLGWIAQGFSKKQE